MREKTRYNMDITKTYSNTRLVALVILRVLIGWHFLYEGIAKLLNPYWTSAGYLSESKWLFSGLFTSLVENPGVLKVVDFLNIWGLIAIGIGLIAGCLTQIASISGIVLLLFYYISNPPFIGYQYSLPAEGSYLIVNKILIETLALFVLTLFPTGKAVGLDRFIFKRNLREVRPE